MPPARIESSALFHVVLFVGRGSPPAGACYRVFTSLRKGKFHLGYHGARPWRTRAEPRGSCGFAARILQK